MWSMITATGHLQHIPDTTNTSTSQTDDQQDQLPLGLDDIRADFLAAFANPPREPETEFAPSVRGALFILNGPRVLDWLESRPDNLTSKLETLETGFATPLYLAVLSRKPTQDEADKFNQYIESQSDKSTAVKQAILSLIHISEPTRPY